MTTDQEYLVVPKPTKALQWTHALLLALLIIGSLIVVAGSSVLYLRNVENEQTAQIAKNQAIIQKMDEEQDAAVALAGRTQRLELKSTQQQLNLLLCTLRPGSSNCEGVVKDARKIDQAIDDLQEDIENHVTEIRSDEPEPAPGAEPADPAPGPEPSPEPSPSPVPSPTPTESPHVGNSDQCPPNNPQCPDD